MRIELDHLFVMCAREAPEAEALITLGLSEGPANSHTGQGTASRRFFFANAYLELLWVSDPGAAQSELVRPTRLWERWSMRLQEASPFGLVLRPGTVSVAPFETWKYRPPYLRPDAAIEIARDTPLGEPGFFFLPFARAAARRVEEPAHPVGIRMLTSVRITMPEPTHSEAARVVEREHIVAFERSSDHLAHLTFDNGAAGATEDLRPTLPLVFHW